MSSWGPKVKFLKSLYQCISSGLSFNKGNEKATSNYTINI